MSFMPALTGGSWNRHSNAMNIPPDSPLQAALTRLIEGEAEPNDDLLIANQIRSNPELVGHIRRQLEFDALLRLEAEPTDAAFVESIAHRIRPPDAAANAFLQRVSKALQNSGGDFQAAYPLRKSWLSWPIVATATAGIVLGILCTTVVFGYIAQPTSKTISLFEASFEDNPAPQATGVPTTTGLWGGDFAEIVGAQKGVTPRSGEKMWRFLRADNAQPTSARANYVGEAIRVIDLKPLRNAGLKPGSQIEVSAWFAQGQYTPEEHRHWVVKAAAFEGQLSDAPSLWAKWDQASTSLAKREVPATLTGRWQWVSTTMVLPANADFLVFECGIVHRVPALLEGVAEFPAQYLDDLKVRLLPPTREPGTPE